VSSYNSLSAFKFVAVEYTVDLPPSNSKLTEGSLHEPPQSRAEYVWLGLRPVEDVEESDKAVTETSVQYVVFLHC
jgi:hypothetical protein